MSWSCPYCGKAQIVGDENSQYGGGQVFVGENEFGNFGYQYAAIGCLNPSCRKVTFNFGLYKKAKNSVNWKSGERIQSWALLPESSAKPQPDFIPKALRDDYTEACRIRDLSPKASATLARRCLQGMIRHFCGISKARLIDEIVALRESVEAGLASKGVTIESVEAIDHVRKIGNIGAHMEKDVDLIIEIDAGEAQALIDLIEMLFVEWYVEQQRRAARLEKIALIGAEKSAAKSAQKDASAPDTNGQA